MNNNIPVVDRSSIAEWALAQMYRAMRLAERTSGDYAYNSELIAKSAPGDRNIPNPSELRQLANDNKWYMQQAQMYAAVFTAIELADESPHRDKYRAATSAVSASLADKQIPRQRVHATD